MQLNPFPSSLREYVADTVGRLDFDNVIPRARAPQGWDIPRSGRFDRLAAAFASTYACRSRDYFAFVRQMKILGTPSSVPIPAIDPSFPMA